MILKRMKRRHTREQAIEFCRDLRARRPDMAFGADLIAGFPTETDEMFENSLRLIDEAGIAFAHVFPYSPRAGTPAARMPQLPRAVIRERAKALREEAEASARAFLDGLVGNVEDGVIESGGRARLGNFAQVRLEERAGAPGEVARLSIVGRDGDHLTAVPVPNA